MIADWENEISAYLEQRKHENTFRVLSLPTEGIDFCSNDYLGLSKSAWIAQRVDNYITKAYKNHNYGATGSRLLSGQSQLVADVENLIAAFHHAESALLFSSGYMANLGIISTIAREGQIIFYDKNIHASLYQGIKLSETKAFSFAHNKLEELEHLAENHTATIRYVVIESIYSMDGDYINKAELLSICKKYKLILIVDEAHAIGIYGHKGQGMFSSEEAAIRIVTYGKALGYHGAAVLTNNLTRDYLINFCKTFIYTTAPSLADLLRLKSTYEYLYIFDNQQIKLLKLINYFTTNNFSNHPNLTGKGPIFGYITRSTTSAKKLANYLQDSGINIKPIVYPTVEKSKERIRINIHSYNTFEDIDLLMKKIKAWETEDIS